MTCQHDETYRIDNEANGGQGCPRCNRRVVMVQHISGAREVDPAFGLTAIEIAYMQARCKETEAEPPTYDGMWK